MAFYLSVHFPIQQYADCYYPAIAISSFSFFYLSFHLFFLPNFQIFMKVAGFSLFCYFLEPKMGSKYDHVQECRLAIDHGVRKSDETSAKKEKGKVCLNVDLLSFTMRW